MDSQQLKDLYKRLDVIDAAQETIIRRQALLMAAITTNTGALARIIERNDPKYDYDKRNDGKYASDLVKLGESFQDQFIEVLDNYYVSRVKKIMEDD